MRKASGWLSAIFAFLSAVLGFASIWSERTIEALDEYRKKTHPEISVAAAFNPTNPALLELVITSKNGLPYEWHYGLLTRKNIILSGIRLKGAIHDPQKDPEPLQVTIELDRKKLIDGYWEVRFNYKSLFADENFKGMGKQATISGQYK